MGRIELPSSSFLAALIPSSKQDPEALRFLPGFVRNFVSKNLVLSR